MDEQVTWQSNVDGVDYRFTYTKEDGVHLLEVNGERHSFVPSYWERKVGIDCPVRLGGREVRFVATEKDPQNADVAVDGVYLRSKKAYGRTHTWALLFSVACGLLIFVGMFPLVLGLAGVYTVLKVSYLPLPARQKMLIFAGVTLLVWGLSLGVPGLATGLGRFSGIGDLFS